MNIEIINGAVTKDGEAIGKITGDTCTSFVAIPSVIRGAINKEMGRKLTYVTEDGIADKTDTLDANGEPPAPKPKKHGIDRLMQGVKDGKIPAPPPTHPHMGDKTPEYVAWFKTHATDEEWSHKYGNRQLPTFADHIAGEKKKLAMLPNETADTGE